ncbi:hypothetical protein A2635_01305 [Candidatus Peribacteria bacterium RIFCSPHIGHO2_01_FULL_51_9]|nr:MAG: hypothetical protein A2635_01305 [Candidatus Peribacteria bacterium RIFCSPHIGHO2_01_FULL_51_9]
MPLNSLIYLLFLGVASILYWSIPQKWRVWILIVTGILFYAYYSIGYLVLLLSLSGVTYFVGWLGMRHKDKWNLVVGISILVLVLALFKYAARTLVLFQSGADMWEIGLPLGISFYTFELIHYLAEVYRGTIKQVNIGTFFAFILFFPTRTSGPIKRYQDFAEQTRSIVFESKYLLYGIALLLLGFFQKIVIADPLIPITSALQSPQTLTGSFDAFVRLVLYSIRIYADFMGLTNIAMGSGLLFGILVPRNFNYPYLQPNIALFWRNWHMSLSNWVRDYIYIPLGGSRGGAGRTYFNLLMTMVILGMWHGSSLNFAVWGLYQGLGLCIHRLWRSFPLSLGERVTRPNDPVRIGRGERGSMNIPWYWFTYTCGVLLTFIFVTIGWAFFVTNSLGDSITILTLLFHV